MSLLTPDPGLVFWMLISFGIVVLVLAKYGFPVILKMVEKRENYIESSILAAQKANEELAVVKETSEALLAQTRQEQTKILNETSVIRDRMIEKAREEARLESDKIIVAAREQIQAEKEEALRLIRQEVTSLSVVLAEKILRKKLGTKEEQMSMIDRLLDEIDISKS
jgi:ATP synthase, F0 subunit b